jgi:hypothetical protein
VGGLHCWRDVRHAVALGVFVVFWLYMSMPTSSMHMLPSLPKDCGVAVTGGCVVESLPSMCLESDLSKNSRTCSRKPERKPKNHTSTLNNGHQPKLYFLHNKTVLLYSWSSVYYII